MLERRRFLGAAIGSVLLPLSVAVQAAQAAPPAAARLNELGRENEASARRVGLWDVTETVWDSPRAAPVSTKGLVAERRLIGAMLQELLRPASDRSGGTILRIDYLSFNRVEGRWDYVSMDMRAPVGIMSAWSSTRGDGGTVALTFQPFAIAGAGSEVTGQMLRMDQVITHQGPDRDMKEQYFTMADGTGTRWLGHRYAYARRP